MVRKAVAVAAGYAAAVAAGVLAETLQSARNFQTSDGMAAFSETLVFLFVFGFAALLPTGAWLYWLRPYAGFWSVISRLALVVAVTAVAAIAVDLVTPHSIWAGFGVLRFFVTPLLVGGFALCAALAPDRGSRALLSLAAGMEGLGALYGFGRLFLAYAP
jgi:hypothetical protein